MLDSIVKARGGTGAPTARRQRGAARRRSRRSWTAMINGRTAPGQPRRRPDAVPRHHGVSRDRPGGRRVRGLRPAARHPATRRTRRRLDAVADSNFSFWHSATFSNDGTKVLFSDEWGGGGAAASAARPIRRTGAPTRSSRIEDGAAGVPELLQDAGAADARRRTASRTTARSIPIPGRDVMVQAWYQGGISVFDWTDRGAPARRSRSSTAGRSTRTKLEGGGSWSAYWYNGVHRAAPRSRAGSTSSS